MCVDGTCYSSVTAMPRDEILRKTKAVSQVLEALRNEHKQALISLQSASGADSCDTPAASDGKISTITYSLEQLELGVSEAQVCSERSCSRNCCG